jgi:hypothetical protein
MTQISLRSGFKTISTKLQNKPLYSTQNAVKQIGENLCFNTNLDEYKLNAFY